MANIDTNPKKWEFTIAAADRSTANLLSATRESNITIPNNLIEIEFQLRVHFQYHPNSDFVPQFDSKKKLKL